MYESDNLKEKELIKEYLKGLYKCFCMKRENFKDFNTNFIGIDDNYGEVYILTCKYCRKLWLKYYTVNENCSESGRWFRGIISQEIANNIEISNTLKILENLDWYIYGGSYYKKNFGISKGCINI